MKGRTSHWIGGLIGFALSLLINGLVTLATAVLAIALLILVLQPEIRR